MTSGIISPGRVCAVIQGSDAGKLVVVTKVIDKNFVTIAGETVKERRINIKHLEPTGQTTETVPKPVQRAPKPTQKSEAKKPKKADQKKEPAKETKKEELPERKKKEDIMVVG